ncbi:hypothetical protein NP493_199g01012 [Ridgeia piscesae]|uniref:Uncharacterized protein n=1 Tax=Ridgeia piscesae TaxID=27915 RepID=A0AAD9P1G3_RIDPI|nr:hypothetical protein NP493_199g01012 [Ridgeia piscesae]
MGHECRILSSSSSPWFLPTQPSQYSTYSTTKVQRVTPLYLQAEQYLDRVALIDCHAMHTYDNILNLANNLVDRIGDLLEAKNDDVRGSRIAILCNNDISYVTALWATWMVQGIAVPLYPKHLASEVEYYIHDSTCSLVITTEDHAEKIQPVIDKIGIRSLILHKRDYVCDADITREELESDGSEQRRLRRTNRLNQLHEGNKFKHQSAFVIYTSGTTGKPKGVVHTHGSLQSQIEGFVTSWGWTAQDVVLHALPPHHLIGNSHILMTAHYCGATCVMLQDFDARKVWATLLSPVTPTLPRSITMFIAVPILYAKLIKEHERRLARGRGTRRAKEYVKAICSTKIRLMVSGSTPLPDSFLQKWEDITGHHLLERYGLTEVGIILSNPLAGRRIPGSVGKPFPNMEVCIARPNVYSKQGYDVLVYSNHRRTQITPGCEGEPGELYIRGPSLFSQYWNKPEQTHNAFTSNGWFKTSDTACFKDGSYHILGRTSVDIIKSGGYKISALDVERHLLDHEGIAAVAVLGLPDITWGQRVTAVVVLTTATEQLSLDDLKEWASERMPGYQIPTVIKVVEDIPRNATGKVNKKQLLSQLFAKELKRTM